ncbi:hypothetical protein J4573_17310 [Actinomadura barringtoniae]|uniref:Uncharacterized protein n=1 Tax=Actinomadura barringtoniae TaxID=1427535 RepID=A0A939T237_9ACTN|nr:hypothetical protein [Actinomadura barringtoniae]MBO2448866.1 hypothetical protein [Actinomadura barringtoniae]
MNESDVLDALKSSMDGVTMATPVEEIVATARRRRARRRIVATAGVATAGLALGVPALTLINPATAPPGDDSTLNTTTGSIHIRTAGFTLDSLANGNVQVKWTKQAYFKDPAGLEAALRKAGFPVLVKVGTFCKGPGDDATLSPAGQGPGVKAVMDGEQAGGGKDVVLVFKRSALPPGKQLFIGYLNKEQLAVTGGNPGSVERIVPASGKLDCDTQAPPPHQYPDKAGVKPVPPDGGAKPK